MGLSNFFKPKWKHSDYLVRLEAVKNLMDEAILTEIVKTDDNYSVRIAALNKIKDQIVLAEIAKMDRDSNVRKVAINIISDQAVIIEIAKTYEDLDVRALAVSKITCQKVLAEIAKKDTEMYVRNIAVKNPYLKDQKLLTKIAETNTDSDVLRNTVNKISDQLVLVMIAKTNKYDSVRIAAAAKIVDQVVLTEIFKTDKDDSVRSATIGYITNQVLLTEIAKTDKSYSVRSAAVKKISELIEHGLLKTEAKSVEPLRIILMQNYFDNRINSIKCSALNILREIGGDDAIELILDVLSYYSYGHRENPVCTAAVYALYDSVYRSYDYLSVELLKRLAELNDLVHNQSVGWYKNPNTDIYEHTGSETLIDASYAKIRDLAKETLNLKDNNQSEKDTSDMDIKGLEFSISDKLKILGCSELLSKINLSQNKNAFIFEDPFLIDHKFWSDKDKVDEMIKESNDVDSYCGVKDNRYRDYFNELKGSFAGTSYVIKRLKSKYWNQEVQYVFIGRGIDLLFFGMKSVLGKGSKSKCFLVDFNNLGPDCIQIAKQDENQIAFGRYLVSIGIDERKKVVVIDNYSQIPAFGIYQIKKVLEIGMFADVEIIDAVHDIALNEKGIESHLMYEAMVWLNEEFVAGRASGTRLNDSNYVYYDLYSKTKNKITKNGRYWGWLTRKEFYYYLLEL